MEILQQPTLPPPLEIMTQLLVSCPVELLHCLRLTGPKAAGQFAARVPNRRVDNATYHHGNLDTRRVSMTGKKTQALGDFSHRTYVPEDRPSQPQ